MIRAGFITRTLASRILTTLGSEVGPEDSLDVAAASEGRSVPRRRGRAELGTLYQNIDQIRKALRYPQLEELWMKYSTQLSPSES